MKPKTFDAFYKSLFDNITDGLAYCQILLNEQGQPIDFIFIKINKSLKELTGLKNVEGKKVSELIPEINISNPKLIETCGRVSLTGKPENFEIYVKSLLKWFSVSVYSLPKNFFVAIFKNITGQKRVEKSLEDAKIAAKNVLEDLQGEKENLARAKAKDEALLESIGEGVVAVDRDGKIVIMSKFTENLLGFTNRELMGKSFIQTVPLEDEKGDQIPDVQQPLTSALTSGKIVTTIYHFTRKNGTKFPAVITAAPVLFNAKSEGAIIVFRDITKEKEIDKLRVDFLALASHQLRTPLSGTKWLIETIRRGILGPMTPKQKEYFDDIYQINERMIKLVSEMLNVLMLESGTAVLEGEKIPVSKLFEELLLMMDPASRDKKIILRNMLKDNETLFIQSNLQVLRSILESFVSNAINYSRSGQEVVLDAREEPAVVIFSVKDSGIGIPKEEQKRIFERFYRASNAKEFRPGGTGLGIYTASLLAKKVNGKIFFESEENKGATFYLQVPKVVDSGDKLTTKQTKIES